MVVLALDLRVWGKLKDEVGGESLSVALQLFVEAFGRHAVNGGKVRIQYNLVTTNGEDERFESSRVRRERFHH